MWCIFKKTIAVLYSSGNAEGMDKKGRWMRKGKYVFRRNLCEEEKEMAKMDSLDTFIGFVHE